MPTDVSSAVQPEYTTAIPVPLDGEYANSTALQQMVLPIANRVQYLRNRFESTPWLSGGFFEDFSVDFRDVGGGVYVSDGPWLADAAPSAGGFGQVVGIDDGAYGVVRHRNSGGTPSEHRWRKSLDLFRIGDLVSCSVRVRLNSIATNMGFTLALDTAGAQIFDGGAGLVAGFTPGVSANWVLRTDNGATDTYVDTGVPVVAGTWYILTLTFDGALAGLSVDGAAPVTTSSTLPAASEASTVQLKLATPAAGGSREILVDFVHLQTDQTARA